MTAGQLCQLKLLQVMWQLTVRESVKRMFMMIMSDS